MFVLNNEKGVVFFFLVDSKVSSLSFSCSEKLKASLMMCIDSLKIFWSFLSGLYEKLVVISSPNIATWQIRDIREIMR